MRPFGVGLFCCATAAMLVCSARAQDAAGCADSPLVTRFPGSTIDSCKAFEDNAFDFPVGPNAKP